MNDDDKPADPNDLPFKGAFPGYEFGKGLFTAWTSLLQQQADIFNDAWGKLATGKYELKDWYQAIAKSVEASSDGVQQMTLAVGMPSSPPWASVPSATAVPIRTRQLIDGSHKVTATLLTRLGGEPGKGEHATAPVLEVVVKGAYNLEVSWQSQPGLTRGQYVGFVLSDQYSQPLAIVTVLVK